MHYVTKKLIQPFYFLSYVSSTCRQTALFGCLGICLKSALTLRVDTTKAACTLFLQLRPYPGENKTSRPISPI